MNASACLKVVCIVLAAGLSGLSAADEFISEITDGAGQPIGSINEHGELIAEVRSANGEICPAAPATSFGTAGPQSKAGDGDSLPGEYSPYTVDRIVTKRTNNSYSTQSGMYVVGPAERYYLSDGSSWTSGAGSGSYGMMRFDHVERDGSTLYFHFAASSGLLLTKTDYDSGDHSANFGLQVDGALVLAAAQGATSATLEGNAFIATDGPANYADSRYHALSAIKGSVVRFTATFTLRNSKTFQEDLFAGTFAYDISGEIDLLDVVAAPALEAIQLTGSPVVPEDSCVQYRAYAAYENGVYREITGKGQWTCSEPAVGTFIVPGKLCVGAIEAPMEMVLAVTYAEGGIERSGEKTIGCVPNAWEETDASWPMYQGNARHDGYLPISINSDLLQKLWEVQVGDSTALNRITAAAGRVYTSRTVTRMDVVDGQTGVVLWTQLFGGYRHGSFPSYAGGIVYIQTGNHSSDTWLRAYDAKTGEPVFKSPHSAQWENYYAPTIYDGRVYINGGYYGGAYCFDAFSGERYWFTSLSQYDQWTPAVNDAHAYAYVGGKLNIMDRATGAVTAKLSGPGSLAIPVIGGNNNIIVAANGGLVSFDPAAGQIAYQIQEGFTGQPSVAKGVIYAVNGGDVEARDEETGVLLWDCDVAENFVGEMIVTDSHVIARTASRTYAISLETHQAEWDYPVSGYMAMSDNRLYVTGAKGMLIAFLAPSINSTSLIGLEIRGPEQINEYSEARFEATALYEGGYECDVTFKADWSLASEIAQMDSAGHVTTFDKDGQIVLQASYSKNGQTVSGQKTVAIVHPVMTYYVDGLGGSDGSYGIREEEPFRTIQRAIDEAWDGDMVCVFPCTYEESIDFKGKAITVRSVEEPAVLFGGTPPAKSLGIPLAAASPTLSCVTFDADETADSVLQNFIIRGSFVGIFCGSGSPAIRNVNVVDNGYGLAVWGDGEPVVTNSIFWSNGIADVYGGSARYCCVQRGAPGEGNINSEPLFADAAAGDYHLVSQRGRYNGSLSQWVLDDATSPCVDGGDPAAAFGLERMPNGGRINMGAYGGLFHASMSEWQQPADLNRDGCVDLRDLALFGQGWLWRADWFDSEQ